jgi:phosphoribosylglycinamide formyltransferase-1
MTQSLVILISGSGSNMQAIVRAAHDKHWAERFGARIAGVVSNRPDAKGLAWAQEQGLATRVVDHKLFSSREAFDAELMRVVDALDPQGRPAWVVLAGFMRILTPAFVQHYEERLLNIHPSLLPAFTGLHTHERAIDAGCTFAGATVHRVTAELDHGEYLDQVMVPVLPCDTPETLAARVLTQEHIMYPRVIERLLHSST